jgi:hypothetical protein
MTIDRMDLMALIEKGTDADFLREMIEVISNRLMEMEVEVSPAPRTASDR